MMDYMQDSQMKLQSALALGAQKWERRNNQSQLISCRRENARSLLPE
jgi:hypothetical protein